MNAQSRRFEKKRLGRWIMLLFIMGLVGGFGQSASSASPDQFAFQHLEEVMDKYHQSCSVYTDLSAAGNHFVALGQFATLSDDSRVRINPGYRLGAHSGDACVECAFDSGGNNWGGWYFMNGVLEGQDTQPRLNWGNHPEAGLDLSGATRLTFWAKGQSGGERIEFFAFGVGRDAISGEPLPGYNYPDSSKKVSIGYTTLGTSWTLHTIDIQGHDLTYVLGGFGWVTNASQNGNRNVVFCLDDIHYDKPRLDEPRFLVSYETIPSSLDFDAILKNVSFTYDNALALIAFLSRGTSDDARRARLLADAFVYALNNDRYFNDGRLRNAYQGGDLVLPAGWKPNGRADTVRMPGWWDGNAWREDTVQVSTDTGNVAWAMIALLSYHHKYGGTKYLDAAVRLGDWITSNTYDTRGAGGYTGGYAGWEPSSGNPAGQTKTLWKSTEHNIDAYVAFSRLYAATGTGTWLEKAHHAKVFVETMWNPAEGRFWTGTTGDGVTTNSGPAPSDVNAWGLMALGNPDKYHDAVAWVENNCYVEADGFKGFDFNNDRDGVWFEGTAHMAVAYQILGDTAKATIYLNELDRARTEAPNGNGKGIVAAGRDGLTTGFDWLYFNRLHIGATAWFIFAERGYNPYWGINATDEIPDPTKLGVSYDTWALY